MSQNNPLFSLPGWALHLCVPPEDFCANYEISKSDEEKMAILKYKPGNNSVLKLECANRKEDSFTSSRWQEFLDAHKHFICNVRSGIWDS